jgi:hypothetical protein
MTEFVRVRLIESGATTTVSRAFADSHDGMEVLEDSPVAANGQLAGPEVAPTKTSAGTTSATNTTTGGVAAKKPEEAS